MKNQVEDLMNRMRMCLDDEFEKNYETDIEGWINELKTIKKELDAQGKEKGE